MSNVSLLFVLILLFMCTVIGLLSSSVCSLKVQFEPFVLPQLTEVHSTWYLHLYFSMQHIFRIQPFCTSSTHFQRTQMGPRSTSMGRQGPQTKRCKHPSRIDRTSRKGHQSRRRGNQTVAKATLEPIERIDQKTRIWYSSI